MRFARTLAAAALMAFVAGCAHVPVSTIYKLWSFDVLAADPAVIRAAVRYPASLSPRPRGAKLTVTMTGGALLKPEVREFILEDATSPADLGELEPYKRDGYPVRAFRLSDRDVIAVRDLLHALREGKARGETRSGNIGVAIDACHNGGLPKRAILTSTYLKLDKANGYMTVLEDIDLRREFGDAEMAKHVPAC